MAALHRACISSGFLGKLGDAFLTLLYRSMVSSPGALLVVASKDGGDDLVGFVSGCENTREFYRGFLTANWLATTRLLAPMVFSLRTIRKLGETASYAFVRQTGAAGLPRAELLSMAVAPSAQGRGLGADLFWALVRRFGEKGCRSFRIVAGAENDQANAFYRKMGCQLVDAIEVHSGEPSNVYVYTMR